MSTSSSTTNNNNPRLCLHSNKTSYINTSKCLSHLKKAGVEFPPYICLKCGKLSLDFKAATSHFESNIQHPLVLNIEKSEMCCFKCFDKITKEEDLPEDVVNILSLAWDKKGKSIMKKKSTANINHETKSNNNSNTTTDSSDYYYSNNNNNINDDGIIMEGDRGLKNLGNTCYMNSTLQCLSRSIALRKCFLASNAQDSGPICAEFFRLINELGLSHNNNNALNPRSFYDMVCKERFGDDQQDAEEFLLYLFSMLTNEIVGMESMTKTDSKYSVVVDDEDATTTTTTTTTITSSASSLSIPPPPPQFTPPIDPITRAFGIETKSQVICQTCKAKTLTVERSPVLHLNFPGPEKSFELDDLIAGYVANIEIDTFRCASCAKKAGFKNENETSDTQHAIKATSFGTLPPAIIMVLSRFSVVNNGSNAGNHVGNSNNHSNNSKRKNRNNGNNSNSGKLMKNFAHVEIPQVLNLERYTSTKAQISFEYELKGLVSHLGNTLYGGHYISVCKSSTSSTTTTTTDDLKTSSWVQISDDAIRKISSSKINDVEAYCLLYERIPMVDV
jgi:ubiquitin C-terminal hydrolase